MAGPASSEEKLVEVRRKSFRDQAIWFLNSSEAGEDPDKCELVRQIEQKCSSIETDQEHESAVDEFTAHRLLEFSNKPCTRNFMESAPSSSSPRRISLAELLIYQSGYDWKKLVNKPQCHNVLAERDARDELEKAKEELDKLTEAAKNAARAAEDAHQSEARALSKELAASKAAQKAQAAKISLDETNEKAGETLQAFNIQEDAVKRKMEELEGIASDSTRGVVSRNRAKAELAILKSEDPITLRTARIHQEAAVRKMTAAAREAEDTVRISETALERATHARKEAIRLKESALAATKRAEEAIPSAQAAFDRISETLEEIISKEKTGKGSIYFMQADLNQSRKKLPKSRFVVPTAHESQQQSIDLRDDLVLTRHPASHRPNELEAFLNISFLFFSIVETSASLFCL
ncbi:hypothetical protein ACHAWF_009551 [Thalassiosira exigua]